LGSGKRYTGTRDRVLRLVSARPAGLASRLPVSRLLAQLRPSRAPPAPPRASRPARRRAPRASPRARAARSRGHRQPPPHRGRSSSWATRLVGPDAQRRRERRGHAPLERVAGHLLHLALDRLQRLPLALADLDREQLQEVAVVVRRRRAGPLGPVEQTRSRRRSAPSARWAPPGPTRSWGASRRRPPGTWRARRARAR
jgi:hypothetical protein